MTPAVLVVGPGAVCGPHPAPDDLVCAAIDAIDDEYALIDERPTRVDDLWASIIDAATGDTEHGLILICPGWWSAARTARIRRAAERPGRVALLRRHEAYPTTATARIEIAPDFVLSRVTGRALGVTTRLGNLDDIAESVAHGVPGCGPVLIDAPRGVPGSEALAAVIAERLRGRGRDVDMIDDAALAAAAAADSDASRPAAPRRGRAPAAVSVSVLVSIGLLVTMWSVRTHDQPSAWITEGRVAVRVPADWVVRRITDGSGSPRVQAFPPSGGIASILLTQSPAGADPAGTAAVLKAALDVQPVGVFIGFRADDQRGGRPVVSYTEIREGREIDWAVFVDGSARIAIGCQQPSDGAVVVRELCDEAIRSARGTS